MCLMVYVTHLRATFSSDEIVVSHSFEEHPLSMLFHPISYCALNSGMNRLCRKDGIVGVVVVRQWINEYLINLGNW
jgi:hypothetical protein